MGNRAVITFNRNSSAECIYLHWNGGRASIEAFLKFARDVGINKLSEEQAIKVLAHSIALWMEVEVNQSTVYLESYGRADKNNNDNGVYVVDPKCMEIIGRDHLPQRDNTVYSEEVNTKKTEQIYTEMLANKGLVEVMIASEISDEITANPEAGSW